MGKIYAAKTNHITNPLGFYLDTVGIFMESERMQRTGTRNMQGL